MTSTQVAFKLRTKMYRYAILHSRSLPQTALISAIVYLLYVSISIFNSTGNLQQTYAIADEAKLPEPEKADNKQMDLLLIKDWHLFGQLGVTGTRHFDSQETPQETQLQLKLLGVFFLPDQQRNSYVIIQSEDQSQKKYRSGDELADGTKLQSISKAQVMLLRNNQRESLSMDRKGNEITVQN